MRLSSHTARTHASSHENTHIDIKHDIQDDSNTSQHKENEIKVYEGFEAEDFQKDNIQTVITELFTIVETDIVNLFK